MFFPKNCAGIWSFLYYWEISNFFFPKTLSYPLDGKWKISFSKKYTEICFFLQMFWKDGLFKKDCAATWYFLHYQGKMVFFPKNIIFFPWDKSEGRSFSRNWWKYGNFCVHVRVLQTWRHAPLSKKARKILSPKNKPKGDWRSRFSF